MPQVGTPVIFFNRLSGEAGSFGVTCDNEEGGRRAADFLIDRGHRRLAYVSALADASTNVERHRGFAARAVERGLDAPVVLEAGSFSYAAGHRAAEAMRVLATGPDGVFCANDIVAIGFLDAVRQDLGLSVPEDLSVIGFDDVEMAHWPSHALTTIRQPVDEMLAATVALARTLGADAGAEPVVRRIARASSSNARRRGIAMRTEPGSGAFFERAVTIHRFDCQAVAGKGGDAGFDGDEAALEAFLPSEAAVRYGLEARLAYDGLRRLVGHLAGLLLLAEAGGGARVLDLPDLRAARDRLAEIEARLADLRPPLRFEPHRHQLVEAHRRAGEVMAHIEASGRPGDASAAREAATRAVKTLCTISGRRPSRASASPWWISDTPAATARRAERGRRSKGRKTLSDYSIWVLEYAFVANYHKSASSTAPTTRVTRSFPTATP